MRVLEVQGLVGRALCGVALFPYQVALGATLRWGEHPGVRVYFGPVKLWLSVLPHRPAGVP